MVNRRNWIGIATILIVMLSLTAGAVAQTKDGELEEVLVTAQKKEQGLQEVPSSVAALSDEKLDVITSTGQDIRLLSSRVPSLHIESSFGRTLPRFYIRGLGNTDFDLNASQPVSLVYDGVVLENPILKGYPIFDMARVEVLRGPQGTLFGRNTPAGIVKFESRKPVFENKGMGRFSYGTYGTRQFEGFANGVVSEDKVAARASFLYQGRSDWVNNTYTGEDDALGGYTDVAARVQFLLTPTDRFNALFNVHMRDLDGTARLFRANIIKPGGGIVDDFERDEIAIDGMNEQTVQEFGGVFTMNYLFDSMTLTSITGYESAEIYSRGDIDGGYGASFLPDMGPGFIPFDSQSADGIPDLTQITQEVRLSSEYGGAFNWTGGFFFFNEDLDIDTFNYDTFSDGQPQNGYANQTQETSAWALFGTAEYQVSEKFKATGGARYSDETKDFMAQRTMTPFGGDNLDPITDSRDSDFVSWDVGGLYTVNNDVNLYGRVARGFRAPSFQGRVLFGDVVTVGETEEITSFEVGTKASMGRKARANFSVYSFTMNDQQLTAVGGEANFNRMINADETAGMGFEAELEWLPMSNVFMTVGASYNKTEIKDENLAIQLGGGGATSPDPVVVPGDPENGVPDIVSIDGNSLPNAPEWVFNATLRASRPMGDSGELFLFTDWAYRSDVHFFLYESDEFSEEGMLEGGVRVGYTTYDRKWEIAAFGRNITDELYLCGGIDFNNLTGFVNEPRTFGMEVRRAF